MDSPLPDYLAELLAAIGDDAGELAGYIPELATADPDRLAMCIATIDGVRYGAGDRHVEYSIQSISKPFVYGLALADHGLDAVLARIDVEPSGEAFNELSLERDSRRPLNPMINAGALTAHALVGQPDDEVGTRVERIRRLLSALAGRELAVDRGLYESELSQAYRNVAIANMLRSYGVITQDPLEVVRGYTQQCAITVTTDDLAMMAAVLAAGGVHPMTGRQVLPTDAVRQVLSVMMTCGMYDAAGDWMTTVGFPAKSGVSGGILGALPGQLGIATFSPRLDPHGNSTRGVRVCTRMSADMGLHIMQAPEPARVTVRTDRRYRHPAGAVARVLSPQGSLQFVGAEQVVRAVTQGEAAPTFVLDLRRVLAVSGVARRMLAETLRRLQRDGSALVLLDPDHVLPLGDDELVRPVERWSSLDPLEGYERR